MPPLPGRTGSGGNILKAKIIRAVHHNVACCPRKNGAYEKYWELFIAFARVGVMTFGGGYAMIPILERELIDKRGWTTNEELMDYYAVAQCTPGVIAVNTATFIGYKLYGVLGGIIATMGVIFRPRHHNRHRRGPHELCGCLGSEERIAGIRVCVRADIQRRCEALEKRRSSTRRRSCCSSQYSYSRCSLIYRRSPSSCCARRRA